MTLKQRDEATVTTALDKSGGTALLARPPRALVFYPWLIEDRTGARQVLMSHSQAMRDAGLRLDLFAPSRGVFTRASDPDIEALFERHFVPPCHDNPLFGASTGDPEAPSISEGRSEGERALAYCQVNATTMLAAGTLLSISDYSFVAVHYTLCHRLKDYIPGHVRKILVVHDIESLVECEKARLANTECQRDLREEVAAMAGFDLVAVFGEDDAATIRGVMPDAPLVVAPFCGKPRRAVEVADRGRTLLWLSSDAEFNRVSFEWFLRRVWPAIRAARPDVRVVVGGRICERAARLGAGGDPAIELRGIVDDVTRLHEEADIMVAPYRFGEGIKTRIVDSMAFGLPVVTTLKGLTNLAVTPGVHLLAEDEPEAFAGAVVQLLANPGERRRLSAESRRFVANHLAQEKGMTAFRDALRNLSPPPYGPRPFRPPEFLVPVDENLEPALAERVPVVVRRCRRRNISRVALYGAGTHTRLLLPLWRSQSGPEVVCILSTDAPHQASFEGLPTYKASEFDSAQVDAVVVSSHRYEHEIHMNCRRLYPNLEIFTLWT